VRSIILHNVVTMSLLGIALTGCDREPRAESGAAAAPTAVTVALTPRALAVTGVVTESATVATLPESFTTTGEIEFDPALVVVVNAPIGGRLSRFSPSVGGHVAGGDTLAAIESPEFLSGGLLVRAPRAGIVTERMAAPGQLVAPGADLLRISGVSRVWLRVDLYGEHASLGRVGGAVEATVAAYPGLTLRGRIASVAPSVEGATQAMAARVPLENPSGQLLPGMFAEVKIAIGRMVRGILVPRTAIIYDGSRRLVMISRDSTYFFPSVVTLGSVVGDRVAVLRGVAPGERVVVKGGYELFNAGYTLTRGGGEEEEGGEK
jgi:multidrug efflux pump subunit AcrA (membrane-fusion protein)